MKAKHLSKTLFIIIGFVSILFSSCSIQKRQHMKGFHIERKGGSMKGIVLKISKKVPSKIIKTDKVQVKEEIPVEDTNPLSAAAEINIELKKEQYVKAKKSIKLDNNKDVSKKSISIKRRVKELPKLIKKKEISEVSKFQESTEEVDRPEWVDWIVVGAVIVLVGFLIVPSLGISLTWGTVVTVLLFLEALGGIIGGIFIFYLFFKFFQMIFDA